MYRGRVVRAQVCPCARLTIELMFKDLSRVPVERRRKQLGRRVPVANLYGLRRYERINPEARAVVTAKIRLTVSSFRAETVITAAGRPVPRVIVRSCAFLSINGTAGG